MTCMDKKINLDQAKLRLFAIFFAMAFIIYFPGIYNTLPNPDAVWNSTVYKAGYGWEVSLGRYLIALLQMLRGNVVNTSFVSMISLLYLSLICVLVVDILKISGGLWQLIAGTLLMISPHVGSELTYYYCSDMYMFSYLLSVMAVWILVKRRSRLSVGISILFIMGSLAVYQAYLGVTIALCFLHLLTMMLDTGSSLSDIIRQAVKFFFSGVGGIILYLISNKVIQNCLDITATEDRGFATMGFLNVRDIPGLLKDCYRFFYHYFFSDVMLNNNSGGRRGINLIFWLLCLLLAVLFLAGKQLTSRKKVICACMAFLLPMAFMSIVILAPEVSILDATGVLMLPAVSCVYLLPVILMQKLDFPCKRFKYFLHTIIFSSCIAVIWMLLILELSGQTYIKYNMIKTDSVADAMIYRIENEVDNSENYRLCIIGNMEEGNYPEQYPELRESVKWTSAYHKTIWPGFFAAQSCWAAYFRDFCGKTYNFVGREDYEKIQDMNILESMADFPDEGSMMVLDDMIIIRLSDDT